MESNQQQQNEKMNTSDKKSTTTTKTQSSVLLNQPIIIDQGTYSIKAGFAGSSKPKAIITNRVGRVKHNRVMPGGALDNTSSSTSSSTAPSSSTKPINPTVKDSNIYIGNVLDEHSGIFQYEYNMHEGRIQNYTNMEHTWDYIYKDVLDNVKYEDHPVLFTEAPYTSMKDRNKLLETWFESYHCPAIYTTPCGILSLYASGRTTGLVLDVGHGVTSTIPVYEGFALQHSIVQSDIGGYDVVNYLQSMLRVNHGVCLDRTTAEWEIVRKMKEQIGIVNLPNTNAKEKDNDMNYKLPDGQSIQITSKQRIQAPEVLFQPFTYLGSEQKSVVDCITTSIQKSDIDLRSTMFNTILLAGGSTLFPNFGNRILHDLRSLSSPSSDNIVPPSNRICVYAPQDRIISSFIGGSILGSLSTFKHLWISKEEWDECGSADCHQLASKFQTVGI